MLRRLVGVATAVALVVAAPSVLAQRSVTARAAKLFGAQGVELVAGKPSGASIGALVEIPVGVDADALGVQTIVPGIGVLRGDAARIAGFVLAHPSYPVEIAPPLHVILDQAVPFVAAERARLGWPGQPGSIDGKGTYVGIVDTGLDVLHPDFRNDDGTSRVAWLLDLSQKPRDGNEVDKAWGGRVFSRDDLNLLIAPGKRVDGMPDDVAGHGTHVAGIAAGNGGPASVFVGVAPSADLVVVRATRDSSGSLDESDAIMGVKFVFDMAKQDGRPAVANLSLGSQFGPHDGTSTFEQALVQLAQGPGRAVVVAASNEGEVFGTTAHPWAHGIHTSVRVSAESKVEIPIRMDGLQGTDASYRAAEVFLWLNFRDGGEIHLGLKGPDGSKWLDDVGPGDGYQVNEGDVTAQIINDVHDNGSIPRGTHGAIVTFRGPLSPGSYTLTLEGEGSVEAWLQGIGDAADQLGSPYFSDGAQIEGTIGVPASADGLISVGCVELRTSYRVGITKIVKVTDPGDVPVQRGTRCFFSSAGPSATGAMRPDFVAPGYFIASALSASANPDSPDSDFGPDSRIDAGHAVLSGTSMSSPFGAGAVALLFEHDPTLTMEKARFALMAGSRPLADDGTGAKSALDYADGAGILDVQKALAALDRHAQTTQTPLAASLQLRLGSSFVPNDGQEPVWIVGIARDADGYPADLTAKDTDVKAIANGATIASPLEHPMTGLYRFSIKATPGTGGTNATVGISGGTITGTRSLPVAADRWDAKYGLSAAGGCSLAGAGAGAGAWAGAGACALLTLLRRRRARTRTAPSADRPGATGAPDRRC